MTKKASPGRGAPKGAPLGPWYFATLVLDCPRCGAAPGAACIWEPSGPPRGKPHYERYLLARELAGRPLLRAVARRRRR